MINIKYFTFNPFQENTYILYDESKECAIIDPGCYDKSEQIELVNFIEKKCLIPVKLLQTHCHIDHVLGSKFIAEKYLLKMEINDKEIPVLNVAEQSGMLWGVRCDTPPKPDIFLNEGDVIRFGISELEILFTPGHSPGSLVFYNKNQKIAVAGDVLFYQSIGRTDLPGGDHGTLLSSIKNKLFPLGDEFKIFPGHGPETTIGFEKENNPFLAQ